MEYNIPELNTLSALEFTSAINKIDLSSIDESVFVADMKWVRPFGMLTASTAIKHLRNQYPDNLFGFSVALIEMVFRMPRIWASLNLYQRKYL